MRIRTIFASLVLVGLVLLLGFTSLGIGENGIDPGNVVGIIATGSGDGAFTLLRLRLPRLVLAILVGAALGIAGTLLQTLLSNPLASPDLIGISQGASAAAVTAILILGWGGASVSIAAFLGAMAVAVLVAALSWRQGLNGQRFVLIGVGLAFVVNALLGYLLTRSEVREAQSALAWLVGSLGTPRWDEVAVTAIGLGVLAVVLVPFAPMLRTIQLGDDAARGLGVPVTPARIALTLLAVGFAAIAIAVAGPVAFVAFVAGPIARRIVGTSEAAVVTSALVGAVVVVGADILAQHVLPTGRVPVGVVTSIIGAPYLLFLLARGNRRRDVA